MPSHTDTRVEGDCNAPVPDNLGPTNLGVSLLQLKILNAVAFITTIAFNGLSASGVLSPYKVGEVADMHRTRISPGGGAFAIWSVIYVIEALWLLYSLFGHCVWPISSSEDALLLHGIGFWFILACLFNSLWIITFVQGNDASLVCSTVLICCLVFSLCKINLGAQCWARRRPGGIAQRCFHTLVVDVHFSMYGGWVAVASILNISAALTSTGWSGPAGSAWAVVMLCVVLLPTSYIVITRQDCAWGFVLAWASFWIVDENSGDTTVVAGGVVVCGLITIVSTVVTVRVLIGAWGSRHSEHVQPEPEEWPLDIASGSKVDVDVALDIDGKHNGSEHTSGSAHASHTITS